jgi:hypothetical protein
MTTTRPGHWTLVRPPERVLTAAHRAFDERREPGARPVELVFDSFAGPAPSPGSATRILLFGGAGLAVLLTSTRRGGVNLLGGAVFTERGRASVVLRRPMRARIDMPAEADGHLRVLTVEKGPACVFASDRASGRTWQTDWLTL